MKMFQIIILATILFTLGFISDIEKLQIIAMIGLLILALVFSMKARNTILKKSLVFFKLVLGLWTLCLVTISLFDRLILSTKRNDNLHSIELIQPFKVCIKDSSLNINDLEYKILTYKFYPNRDGSLIQIKRGFQYFESVIRFPTTVLFWKDLVTIKEVITVVKLTESKNDMHVKVIRNDVGFMTSRTRKVSNGKTYFGADLFTRDSLKIIDAISMENLQIDSLKTEYDTFLAWVLIHPESMDTCDP